MLPYFKNCKICGALRAQYFWTFIVQQRLFAFGNRLPCIQMCCRPNHMHFNFKIKSQTQYGYRPGGGGWGRHSSIWSWAPKLLSHPTPRVCDLLDTPLRSVP